MNEIYFLIILLRTLFRTLAKNRHAICIWCVMLLLPWLTMMAPPWPASCSKPRHWYSLVRAAFSVGDTWGNRLQSRYFQGVLVDWYSLYFRVCPSVCSERSYAILTPALYHLKENRIFPGTFLNYIVSLSDIVLRYVSDHTLRQRNLPRTHQKFWNLLSFESDKLMVDWVAFFFLSFFPKFISLRRNSWFPEVCFLKIIPTF